MYVNLARRLHAGGMGFHYQGGMHTCHGLPSIVWIILWLKAAFAAVAELPNVDATDTHFALSVLVFFVGCEACEAHIFDELI